MNCFIKAVSKTMVHDLKPRASDGVLSKALAKQKYTTAWDSPRVINAARHLG